MTVSGLNTRLSAVRRHESLSQEEMAQRLEISRSAYQYYERGQRDVTGTLLLKIFQEFDVDPLWMLEGDLEHEGSRRHKEITQAYRKIGLAVEERIRERDLNVTPDKKWDAIDFLFSEFLNADTSAGHKSELDTGRIDGVLRLVA